MPPRKAHIDGDRNVLITGTIAIPQPEYDEGEVRKSDAAFADPDNTYTAGIVVRPDGTLALKDWPPVPPAEDKDEGTRSDGSELSDQEKAISKSEKMKGDVKARQAPILKI